MTTAAIPRGSSTADVVLVLRRRIIDVDRTGLGKL
jgi:hypothetical protein